MNILGYNRDSAFRAVAAATITAGQLVGLNSSGKAVLADADAATPIEAVGFALEDAKSGDTIGVAQIGRVEDTSATYTVGAKLWLSGTAGGVTETKVSTAGNIIQPVGTAISATKAILNVSPCAIKLQASGATTVTVL